MKNARRNPTALRRWLRFNFVGVIGIGVQLAVLELVVTCCGLDYRIATLIAVEAAVLHNFYWHLRYTWRERHLRTAIVIGRRLAEFHLTNGLVSLAGSWTLVSLLAGRAHLPLIIANLISIGACSLLNFLLAEVVVFRGANRRKRARTRDLGLRLPCLDG